LKEKSAAAFKKEIEEIYKRSILKMQKDYLLIQKLNLKVFSKNIVKIMVFLSDIVSLANINNRG
jgi:hypothetical protein